MNSESEIIWVTNSVKLLTLFGFPWAYTMLPAVTMAAQQRSRVDAREAVGGEEGLRSGGGGAPVNEKKKLSPARRSASFTLTMESFRLSNR